MVDAVAIQRQLTAIINVSRQSQFLLGESTIRDAVLAGDSFNSSMS